LNSESSNHFKNKTVCFFSTVPSEKLQFENYSLQDIRILEELGFKVEVVNTFSSIPLNCDLYFSWWASGSILPLIKALLSLKPIIIVAGGNEAMLYRDSVSGKPVGYLNSPIWKKLATRFSLRFSTKVLVVSNFMLHDVRWLGARNPLVVHNCVNTEVFSPRTERGTYITSIFRLDRDTVTLKRGEIFIRAIAVVLKMYPSQQFLIIGRKGNDFERIQKLILELNIDKNIKFVDEVANSEVISWIQHSALYVQISDTETFGLAIAEAMSCEVPVLVSHRGAIPEVVGEAGIYVDHNLVDSVANGLLYFLSMDTLQVDKIGRILRARILSHYSYTKRKAQLFELFKSVLVNE
jgi:glycosyltransferase involved in cell wall biosynthesis